MKTKALFLDRDGIINEALPRGQYLTKVEEFKLKSGIGEIINFAKGKGYLIVVATNQPQVAKGLLTVHGLQEIHNQMSKELELAGAAIDKIYYCPHQNNDNCECRKPKPGMIRRAVAEFNVDAAKSFFVGDSDKDINAGATAGCKTIFVKNEFNGEELKNCRPDFVVSDLTEIKKIILA